MSRSHPFQHLLRSLEIFRIQLLRAIYFSALHTLFKKKEQMQRLLLLCVVLLVISSPSESVLAPLVRAAAAVFARRGAGFGNGFLAQGRTLMTHSRSSPLPVSSSA